MAVRSDRELCRDASAGEKSALEELLSRYRDRLKRMLAVRMHPRLAKRCDPSDVVQDALAEATRRLPEYLGTPELPFYVWLRQLGLDRLTDYHRRHLYAQSRSVFREEEADLSDESVETLAQQLAGAVDDPARQLAREERRQRVRRCLEQLRPSDRELLLMRFAEQLQLKEIAAALGLTEAATKSRLHRALEKLLARFGDGSGDSSMGPRG